MKPEVRILSFICRGARNTPADVVAFVRWLARERCVELYLALNRSLRDSAEPALAERRAA